MVSKFDEEPGKPESWQRIILFCLAATDVPEFPGNLDAEARADLDALVGGAVDAVLSRKGLGLSSSSRDQLMFEAAIALATAAGDIMRKAEGDYSPTTTALRYPVWKGVPDTTDTQGASQSISGLFDLWRADRARNGGAESSARRWKVPVDNFIAFLGHDDAGAVTLQDIIRWKNAEGEAGDVSATTFSKVHLAAVKAIFSHGVNNLLIDKNPVLGIKSRAPKALRTRPKGFTAEEAKAILKAANGALTAPGGTGIVLRRALRWVPWLCAYTGARVGEMAQLRREDVMLVDGVMCLRITPEAGAVKTGTYRDVPVHPHLAEMGFLDFVSGQPAGALFYAHGAKSATPWTAITGRLSAWVRETAGVTDKRVAPNHGWRHLFKTTTDEVGIDPKYSDAICGHSGRTQGDKYGHRTPKTLLREIEKLPRWEV